MLDTMTRYLSAITEVRWRKALSDVLSPMVDRTSSQPLTSAGIVIKAGGSALAKTGSSSTHVAVQGKLARISASTDLAALSGTVTNAKFNVFCWFIDSGGTVTSQMGTEGATRAALKFPTLPVGKTLIGFVIINPTGTGNFVGGTTALDDGTVVPNAEFISLTGDFDPTVLI